MRRNRSGWAFYAALLTMLMLVLAGTAGVALANQVKHVVQSGDTLYSLARRYGVSVDALIQVNNIKNPDRLSIGMELLVPSRITVHEVAKGDTLFEIARKYGVEVKTLTEANGITNPNLLRIGQRLIIPGTGPEAPAEVVVAHVVSRSTAPPPTEGDATEASTTHIVVKGDTLWSLGQRYGTTPQAIAAASGITVASVLRVGQKLTIPGEGVEFRGAQAIPWKDVHRIFRVGTVARVTDVKTGLQFQIVRRGGTNHADCEPWTASDSAVMKRIWGGWSWDRRAIVVEFDGYRIAASMHAMPHGGQGITNNQFPGHFCVHFLNSMTHGSSYTASGIPQKDPQHQAMVRAAVGQ
ncbi:MAG: LysM peptidoglycan-binding domain-containing protein [Bacillota bacterium]